MGIKFSRTAEHTRRGADAGLTLRSLKRRLAGLDRVLLRGSTLAAIGLLAARSLGFAFHLVLARAFLPQEYGEIRYAILLGELTVTGTQPFGQHVVARFTGAYQSSPAALQEFFAGAWPVLALVMGLSVILAAPILAVLGQLNTGILVIFLGLSVYYAYWGLARGFLAAGKLALAAVAGNVLQLLLVLLLVQVFQVHSTRLVLAIYGGSYLLPAALLQALAPFPIRFQPGLISWPVIRELLRFSLPVWCSHAAYLLHASLDVLLLERFTDLETVGVYALAKTLSSVFLFAPAGISAVLMPRVASLPGSRHRRLLAEAAALALAADAGILLVYATCGSRAIRAAFGAAYLASPGTLLALSGGTVLYGVYSLASSFQVGRGRAGVETASRLAVLGAAALAGWLLVPAYGGLGAALSTAAGAAGGLAAYGAMAVRGAPVEARKALARLKRGRA